MRVVEMIMMMIMMIIIMRVVEMIMMIIIMRVVEMIEIMAMILYHVLDNIWQVSYESLRKVLISTSQNPLIGDSPIPTTPTTAWYHRSAGV